MGKWWHTAATLLGAATAVLAPQLAGVIAVHPKATVALGTAWAILGHLLPSPIVDQR